MRPVDRAGLLRRLSLGAGAAAVPGLLATADALAAGAEDGAGNFPAHPRWRFTFLSHETTDPLFVPLQYGLQDACALVGCSHRWAGSARGDVTELAAAFDKAVSDKADGIAVTIADAKALAGPVARALAAGIPVVAFHLDARGSRLAFVGQDPYAAGLKTGQRFAALVRSGEIALLAGSPASRGVRERIAGIRAAFRSSGLPVTGKTVATAADAYGAEERIAEYVEKSRGVRGLLAVDAVSTEGAGLAAKEKNLRARGVRAAGYGVLPATLKLVQEGHLEFTVDEQPYLQGFLSALQLFLVKLSGGLVVPSDVRTGSRLVTRANLKPYLAKTRFEGSSSKHRYPIA